jgi:hypothetical protein
VGIGVYYAAQCARENGMKLLVVDILDEYPTLISKMKLMGMETDALENANVIKLGGSKTIGNIKSRINEISEPVILSKKYNEAYRKVLSNIQGPVLILVLGVEKLSLLLSSSERAIQLIVNQLARHIGDRRKISIFLINTDAIPKERRFMVNLLEDMATTVIRTSKTGRMTEFHIVKSLNRELEGVCIRI